MGKTIKLMTCLLLYLCICGCGGENQKFMKLCMKDSKNSDTTLCKCLYNGVSKKVDNMDNYIVWLAKQGSSNVFEQIKATQFVENTEQGKQYYSLTMKYVLLCTMTGAENVDAELNELKSFSK